MNQMHRRQRSSVQLVEAFQMKARSVSMINWHLFIQACLALPSSLLFSTLWQGTSHKVCYLLTLMKIRLNTSNYDLRRFTFCVHVTTVSRNLTKWIQLMDTQLSSSIQWPEKEQLQKTMPWCFRLHYGLKVPSIIDCFELYIEKPGDLMSKAVTWSTYKHHNTVKFLISVTPQGTVSFVSKGYGGRVSDEFITEHYGYLDNLQPGDLVLADCGFIVEYSMAYGGAP